MSIQNHGSANCPPRTCLSLQRLPDGLGIDVLLSGETGPAETIVSAGIRRDGVGEAVEPGGSRDASVGDLGDLDIVDSWEGVSK